MRPGNYTRGDRDCGYVVDLIKLASMRPGNYTRGDKTPAKLATAIPMLQ